MEFSEDIANALVRSVDNFPIDFDDAWQWIGYSTKQKAFQTLKSNFEEGIDFLTKGLKSSTGGRPSDHIGLTIDCFKSLAMMAGTKRGKEVRRYFLECERQLKEEARSVDQRLARLESAIVDLYPQKNNLLPALSPNLAAQFAGANPHLFWILQQAKITLEGRILDLNFTSRPQLEACLEMLDELEANAADVCDECQLLMQSQLTYRVPMGGAWAGE